VPKDNEVLIRVQASTVTAGDCELRSLKLSPLIRWPMRIYAGLIRPKRVRILGQEFAGTVESTGKQVTRYRPGDEVFGLAGFGAGGYAEYICLPETPGEMDGAYTSMPEDVSFQEAAAISVGGLESFHYLTEARIRPGQHVLIIGAGGSIGTIGVQLAKRWGAVVTAVDRADKLEMLKSLGADHVVDYQQEDATKYSARFDVVLDIVGRTPIGKGIRMLKDTGIYLMANPRFGKLLRGRLLTQGSARRLISGKVESSAKRLDQLKTLVSAGEVQIVIDRTYPLAQTADAHRYVEEGNKQGNVVILIQEDTEGEEDHESDRSDSLRISRQV